MKSGIKEKGLLKKVSVLIVAACVSFSFSGVFGNAYAMTASEKSKYENGVKTLYQLCDQTAYGERMMYENGKKTIKLNNGEKYSYDSVKSASNYKKTVKAAKKLASKAKNTAAAKKYRKKGNTVKEQKEEVNYIANYLMNNVKYKSDDKNNDKYAYASDALLNHKAKCMGLSAAFDLTCYYAGIYSDMRDGYLSEKTNGKWKELGAHQWNHVKIGKKQYLIDITNYIDECDWTAKQFAKLTKDISYKEICTSRYSYNIG